MTTNNTNTYNITIAKTGRVIKDIDFDSFPEITKRYIITYGLKQALNDCHSQYNAEAEKRGEIEDYKALADSAVENRFAQLQDGLITSPRNGSRSADPVEQAFQQEGWAILKAATGKTIKTIKSFAVTNDKSLDDMLGKLAESRGEKPEAFIAGLKAEAAKRVTKAQDGIAVDLDSLIG